MQIRTCSLLLLCLLPLSLSAQEWTRFRGENGAGVGKADLPDEWNEGDYNWKVELPGIGHSSPVLWGDRVFLMSADPDTAERYCLCIAAADGKILWNRKFASEPHHPARPQQLRSCTPCVDSERVYFAWSTPAKITLIAFDHEGKTAWEKDLGRWESQHGFGASPILYEDKLILFNSQQAEKLKPGQRPGDSYMMAFDRKTGKEIWKTERKSVNVCYSVPCIHKNADGKDELVTISTGDGVFALDPDSGKPLWAIDEFSMRTVASPVIAGDLIIGSTGSGGGGNYVVAVKPGDKAEEVWRIKTAANYVPTPLYKDGLLFLWFDKGIVSCVDAASGKVHWRRRAGKAFSGSPVLVGDKMFGINEDGDVIVISATKEYKLLGEVPLGEASRSTPAVSGGRIYFRTYSHLFSLGGKSA